MEDFLVLDDPHISYNSVDDAKMVELIEFLRNGISFQLFLNIVKRTSFSIYEWASFLHLSERTLQRYHKESKRFDAIHSEKIVEITMLYNLGIEVFGDKSRFDSWLNSNNIALGNTPPKSFLDSSFGIDMLKDELQRIDQGILA